MSLCGRGFLFCPFTVCFREKAQCPVEGCFFCYHFLRTSGKCCLCMQHHRVSAKGSQTLKTKNKTTEASNLTFLHRVLGCAIRCCSDDRIWYRERKVHSSRLQNSRVGKPMLHLAGPIHLTFSPSLDTQPHPSRACTWPPHWGHFFLSHLFWLKAYSSERTNQLDWKQITWLCLGLREAVRSHENSAEWMSRRRQ